MTEKDILRELGNIESDFIEQAAPPQSGDGLSVKPKKVLSLPKKMLAFAASLVLVLGAMSLVGFDKVYSAMQGLFSFIPGVGIEIIQDNSAVYSCKPIREKIGQSGKEARLLRATYSKGILNASVLVNKFLTTEDIKIYINGTEYKKGDEGIPAYSLAVANESSLLELGISADTPQESDIFEIEIAGFEGRLSFSVKPCETYRELREIGPTKTENGITVTATATRFDNELTVWCYATRTPDATNDELVGIGKPANGANSTVLYLQTNKGKIYDNNGGWQLFGRSVYELSGDESSAVLHVPYLAMLRGEKGKFKVTLPESEGITPTDCTAETSLGNIKITEIQRSPSQYDKSKDSILLKFAYENAFENMKIYGLAYVQNGHDNPAVRYHTQDGTTEYLEFNVDKNCKSLSVSFDGIYYYLTDEYSFRLI